MAHALEEATAVLRRARTLGAPAFLRRACELLRGRVPIWARYVACGVVGAVLMATTVAWRPRPERQGPSLMLSSPAGGVGWAGLGDTGVEETGAAESAPSKVKGVAKPVPEEPLEGQRRAPRCRPPVETTINEGCWILVGDIKPPCEEPTYEWKGRCYIPTVSLPGKPISEPP